jgi:hypothetical protein
VNSIAVENLCLVGSFVLRNLVVLNGKRKFKVEKCEVRCVPAETISEIGVLCGWGGVKNRCF